MMKKFKPFKKEAILVFVLFCHTVLQSLANIHLTDANPGSFALGSIQSVNEEWQNPAVMSFSDRSEVSISVFNRFSIKELNTASIYFKHPNKWLDNGVKLSRFGYSDYQIISFESAFSKKILQRVSLGTILTYTNKKSLLEEKNAHLINAHIGIYCELNKDIILALLINNVLDLGKKNHPNGYVGLKYKAYENSSLFIETGYNYDNNLLLSLGFEYILMDQFIIRSGIKIKPMIPSLGFGYSYHNWIVESGFSLHSNLGVSSIIGVKYLL